jgi:hypothetical protein
LARKNGGPHDVSGPELKLVFRGNAMRPEQRKNDIAEQGAFGVDLGRHDHSAVARLRWRADQNGQNNRGDGGKRAHSSYHGFQIDLPADGRSGIVSHTRLV